MFDDALLESRRRRTWNGKRFGLPLALGFHAAVIGAFVGASAWFTGEAPEPVIAVVFPATSSAPPPPLGGGEIHTVSSNSRPLVPIQAMVQPVLANIEDSKAVDDDAGQAPPGPADSAPSGPGLATGVPDGTGPLGVGPVGPGGPEEIRRPGGDVHAPVLLERAEPDYPEAARRAHLQGTVILEAIITASGAVEEIRVLRPLNSLLDEAAERAVRRWRYRPATLNGRAVPVYLTVTVRFGLNG
jgi:protein TonB